MWDAPNPMDCFHLSVIAASSSIAGKAVLTYRFALAERCLIPPLMNAITPTKSSAKVIHSEYQTIIFKY